MEVKKRGLGNLMEMDIEEVGTSVFIMFPPERFIIAKGNVSWMGWGGNGTPGIYHFSLLHLFFISQI